MVENSADLRPSNQRSCSLDYLRATIIILVLYLHTIACYLPWARFNLSDYVHSTAPIIDTSRSTVFNLMPLLLNGFFMALLFFLSGLFVWKSLYNKGITCFLKVRLRRLGIPFLIMVTVIMPIAYYPSFLQTGAQESFFSYWFGWSWISGPAWYLSLLFGFDLLAAIFFRVAAKSWRRVPEVFIRKPSLFFCYLSSSQAQVSYRCGLCMDHISGLNWALSPSAKPAVLGYMLCIFLLVLLWAPRDCNHRFLDTLVRFQVVGGLGCLLR